MALGAPVCTLGSADRQVATHTHTHTHSDRVTLAQVPSRISAAGVIASYTHVYVYMCVFMCVCVSTL